MCGCQNTRGFTVFKIIAFSKLYPILGFEIRGNTTSHVFTFFPKKYKIKIVSACRTEQLQARSLGWKRPECYSKTIILYFTESVLKTCFERNMALKLCIFIFLKYPNNLTSVPFARPSSFSLLQICLPVIWIHVLPLQGKELSHWMTSTLRKLGLEFVFICWQLILKESLKDESCSFLGRKLGRKYLTRPG